jgi:hypothetical protein
VIVRAIDSPGMPIPLTIMEAQRRERLSCGA